VATAARGLQHHGAAAAKMTAKASGDCSIGKDGVTARK